MTKSKINVWNPDATAEFLEWQEATDYICDHWAELDNAWWETREAGVDTEDSWESENNPVHGLEAALDIVLPYWREAGLTHVKAAALAMDIGLICTVEWELDD